MTFKEFAKQEKWNGHKNVVVILHELDENKDIKDSHTKWNKNLTAQLREYGDLELVSAFPTYEGYTMVGLIQK